MSSTTINNPNPVAFDDEIQFSPEPFKAFMKKTHIKNDELCRLIKAKYSDVFHDLIGVNIEYDPVHRRFGVAFYFENNTEPVPDGKYKNLVNLSDPSSGSNTLFTKNLVLQHKINGEKYTLNDETKVLLSDIMRGGREANKPGSKNWNQNITEKAVAINSADPFYRSRNAGRVLVQVTGIDIHKLLQKIYGSKMVINTESVSTPDGGEADANIYAQAWYQVQFVRALPDGTFCLNIDQFDKGQVEAFTIAENPAIVPTNGIRYY